MFNYISIYNTNFLLVLGFSLFKILAILSFPVAVVKALISLLHCYVACQNLSIIDIQEREANKLNSEHIKKGN